MPNPFTKNTFDTTYRDRYRDSDNVHKILFRGARQLQAAELTEIQSIINGEMTRLGNHLFQEGSPVNPGGMTINNRYEFVKIEASEVSTGFAVGDTLTGGTSGISAKLIEIVEAEDGDPLTFYVTYLNTSSATAGSSPLRFVNGESLSNGTVSVAVQTASDEENPHVGLGTKASVNGGSFWVRNHFVHVNPQSAFIDKYSNTPTGNIGMRVVEDVITVDDDDKWYDNQNNGIPNLTAPGADRYRITLDLIAESQLDSGDQFFAVNRMINGSLQSEVDRSQYGILGKEIATRTKEESGDYVVEGFQSKFEEGESDGVLTLNVSPGVGYVDGYRVSIRTPTKITVKKPRTTDVNENEAIAANYDNYVLIQGGGDSFSQGLPNIQTFEQMNLRTHHPINDSGWYSNDSGLFDSTHDILDSDIGTARIRSVTKDGANFRWYLFDVQMNEGRKFSEVRSIGTDSGSFGNIALEGGVAVIKQAVNNNLFFDTANIRPISLADASVTVQRRFDGTTDGSGNFDISGDIGVDETFVDQTQWIVAADSTDPNGVPIGTILTDATATGGVISTSNPNTSVEVLAFVNKTDTNLDIRSKTRTTVADNGLSVDSDGAGAYWIDLSNRDIIEMNSLTDAVTGTNLLARFTLDDGQRDNYYGFGRLNLRGGLTPPTNDVNANYDYFAHGNGDFFAVNSYAGEDYNTIPKFRQRNGLDVELRNVLDFRPLRSGDGSYTTANINELPQNTAIVTADVTYYQKRKDILTLTPQGLDYITGTPSVTEVGAPQTPINAMKLKDITLSPYVDDEEDLSTTIIENRRFTMRDISKIVERIDNIEEATALNLLEIETSAIEVLDSNGNDRFKNGFFADNFTSLEYSDFEADQYTATLEINEGVLMPDGIEKAVPLVFDSENSSNVVLGGDQVMLSYSEVDLIDQNLCSETENINPYEVITFAGQLTLTPNTDEWVERNVVSTRTRIITRRVRTFGRLGGSVGRFAATDRVLSVELAPFIRSRLIQFRAEGLKPNTRHFAYFDGVGVQSYAREETDFTRFSRRGSSEFLHTRRSSHPYGATNLFSDANGLIIGSILIPNNNSQRFEAGERLVKLLDISVNDDEAATSSAEAPYFAQGYIQNLQRTILVPRPRRSDPLAQSFSIQNDTGAFVTKIDVYFSTKPQSGDADQEVPVRLQVRPIENGVPSQTNIVPGSEVAVNPSDVNIPGTLDDLTAIQGAATSFVFDSPIYIPGNTEYCFVILADTVAYNVYVSRAGDYVIGTTDARIARQPSLGSLFMSQNSLTWTPDQERDMMFKIHRADFVSSGTAKIENFDIQDAVMDQDPIDTIIGSSTITVNHRGHGLGVGDVINVSGVDSDLDIGGIQGKSILGSRMITKVDGTAFQFVADSAATASTFGGDSSMEVTQNVLMDAALFDISTLIPASGAKMTFQGDFTDGYSLSNPTPTYGVGTTGVDMVPGEVVLFDDPKIAAAKIIEDAEGTLGGAGTPRRSVEITANMSTTDTYISPVINMDRAGLIAVNNLIDNQDSDAGSVAPLNNPIVWVDETHPSNGSHLSKHLTVPITLEQPAVGLKVLLGANRPSGAEFDVYYRTIEAGADNDIEEISWVKADADTIVPTDENRQVFRQYEYTIGGLQGKLIPFTTFQLKLVMRSSNSSKIPVFRDLRAIALGT